MNGYWLGVLFALFSVLTTAGNRVLLSRPLISVDSRFATYFASLVGLTLLFTVDAAAVGLGRLGSTTPYELTIFLLVGVLNSGVSRLLLYLAIRHIGANQAESLQAATPLFTYPAAIVFLGEHLTPLALLGGVLILLGSIIIKAKESSRVRGGDPGLGVLCALLSSLVFAAALTLIKAGLSAGYPYIQAVFVSSVGALAFNNLLYNPKRFRRDFARTPRATLTAMFSASALIAYSQIFRFAAFNYTPAVVASTLISTSPALVVLLNRASANRTEIVTPRTALSVALVVLGGILTSQYSGA